MKKISFGVILLGLFALGCEQKIEAPKGSEPTFTVQQGDTLVRTQVNTPLIKAVFVDNQGGHTVSRAVITVTGDNGFKLADMKDLALTISSNAGGQAQYGFATLQSQQSVDLNFVLGTGQTLAFDVSAYNDLAHNARVKIGLEIFYTGPSGARSIKREGLFIRAEKSGVVFKAEDPLPLRNVLTSAEVEVFAFSLKAEGLTQKLDEIVFRYSGTLGHETIFRLMLYTKQGVKIGEKASPFGEYRFDNFSGNLSTGLNEFVVKAKFREGIRTGDNFNISLVSIKTEDLNGEDYEIKPVTLLPGNEFVTFASLLEAKSNPLANAQARNGEVVLASYTLTSKSGSTSFLQCKKRIVIANNGPQDTIDIRNFKLRIGGVIVPATQVFFSKPNGDTAKVHTILDEFVYITLLGGRTMPAGQSITVDLIGTLRGVGTGDAVSTSMIISDGLDLDRRYITRAPNQHLGRLHTSPALSANGVVYDFLWSDRSAPNHSGITGISSPDWSNGRFIDTKHLYASVLQ